MACAQHKSTLRRRLGQPAAKRTGLDGRAFGRRLALGSPAIFPFRKLCSGLGGFAAGRFGGAVCGMTALETVPR